MTWQKQLSCFDSLCNMLCFVSNILSVSNNLSNILYLVPIFGNSGAEDHLRRNNFGPESMHSEEGQSGFIDFGWC